MVEQVRRHGRDPFAYFEWIFEKLMHNPAEEDLPSLLPTSWLETQDASQSLLQKIAEKPEAQHIWRLYYGALFSAYLETEVAYDGSHQSPSHFPRS